MTRRKRKPSPKTRERWIAQAIKRHGALRRQLKIPSDKIIPKTFLDDITRADIGETVKNPTKTGKRRVTVTRLLKQRAVLARTLRGIGRGR